MSLDKHRRDGVAVAVLRLIKRYPGYAMPARNSQFTVKIPFHKFDPVDVVLH